MKKLYILAFVLAISLQVAAQKKSDKTEEIVFLSTNDIHGSIDNFARLAFVADSIKKIYENVYLLVAGDIFTGNPMVDMYKEKGFPVIDLMNRVGYTVAAIGNHDFDYGQEVLNQRMKDAKFPFVCANIVNKGGKLNEPNPYYQIKSKNNIHINILSILDNSANGNPETHPLKIVGLQFPDPIQTALKYKKLSKKNNLLIALTHVGIENDLDLANKMPEIDLIIGGHSHTFIDSMMLVNGVMITQVGGKLSFLGEIKLKVQKGKILDKTYKVISLKGKTNVNNEIKELVNSYNQNPLLKEVLGKAKNKLSGKEELGCFYTDALRKMNNFDIVFQNSGGIRISEIPEGDIIVETIYKLDPFGNYLMGLDMSTDEIRSLIHETFNEGNINLRVSGMHYNIVKQKNTIKEIKLTYYNGKPLDENKKYYVGMNDYILSTVQFSHADKGKSLGITTAEVIMDYLKKVGEINYSGVQRTFLTDL